MTTSHAIIFQARACEDSRGAVYVPLIKKPSWKHFQGDHALKNTSIFPELLSRALKKRYPERLYLEALPAGACVQGDFLKTVTLEMS